MERIEIFTGEQRRRRYTPQEKVKFFAMTMQPGYSVSLVARQNGITPSLTIGSPLMSRHFPQPPPLTIETSTRCTRKR